MKTITLRVKNSSANDQHVFGMGEVFKAGETRTLTLPQHRADLLVRIASSITGLSVEVQATAATAETNSVPEIGRLKGQLATLQGSHDSLEKSNQELIAKVAVLEQENQDLKAQLAAIQVPAETEQETAQEMPVQETTAADAPTEATAEVKATSKTTRRKTAK